MDAPTSVNAGSQDSVVGDHSARSENVDEGPVTSERSLSKRSLSKAPSASSDQSSEVKQDKVPSIQFQSEEFLLSEFHLHYEVVKVLGAGACGRVYKVIDRDCDENGEPKVAEHDVAKECFAAKVCDCRHQSRDAFYTEYSMLKMASGHKNCISLVDAYWESPYSYIILETCDWALAKALAKKSIISEQTVAFYFRQACEALVHIHNIGIVHRDIKPDNFMVTGSDETVKLIDFGVVAMESKDEGLLLPMQGTAPFMSPEMVREDGYDKGTDVWSLGVSVYVLMLGEFPYQTTVRSTKVMQGLIRLGRPEPGYRFEKQAAKQLGEGATISAEAEDFLRALLQRRPQRRPSAAEALHHPWLAGVADVVSSDLSAQTNKGGINLKVALQSAAQHGAFSGFKAEPNEELDGAMLELQAHTVEILPRLIAATRDALPAM